MSASPKAMRFALLPLIAAFLAYGAGVWASPQGVAASQASCAICNFIYCECADPGCVTCAHEDCLDCFDGPHFGDICQVCEDGSDT